MKKIINKAHVEGRISESTLEVKVSKKGITYIGGKLDVATDNEGLNIVTVEFPYVAERFNNGNENKTYGVLKNIIEHGKTIMGNPGEEATMVRLDPSISLNEWYRDENGTKTLVSTKRLTGGFAHIVNSINADEVARNKFECDMVITGTSFFEGDEERGTQDKLVVKGCTFDFAGRMLPIELSVTNPNGIKYFEDKIDASPANPVFTKVWGKVVNETIITQITEESAFGEPIVKEVKKNKRDWVLTGMAVSPYEFDDETTITAQELKDAIAEREVYKAELLQAQEAREAEKAKGNNAFTATSMAPANGGFNF